MTYRPRIPDDIHRRVRVKHFDDDISLNEIYIRAIEARYTEDGEYTDSYKRLSKADENLDFTDSMTVYDVLEFTVKAMFDENGEPRPGAKQLFEREKNKRS